MDAQTIFYTLGSVFMILGIITLIAVIVGIVMIVKAVNETKRYIEEKLDSFKETIMEPTKYIKGMGAFTSGALAFGLKQFFNRFQHQKD